MKQRNTTSSRHAVFETCWCCVGGDLDGETYEAIRECTVYRCYLWAERPGEIEGDAELYTLINRPK